ncbi:carbohydrate ABC transporter permease [Butyrivibrio sp. AD3002]|uniref:carbohydrate ABC transporter permease n=1 Tax=Butyrivibrio sp. AD3002 TaxID=1280670 RepID=UPI0003B49097|nr:carbohydrate ABC transporter permease [Butyrivibrio sp. AD3002]
MKQKMTVSRAIFLVFAVILLIGIAAACLFPLWHVIMVSISNPTEVTSHKGLVLWRLKNFDFQAYNIIFSYQKLWSGYLNTIIYILLSCAFTGVLTVIAGFVFSRKRFRYRNAYMLLISFTMLFNGGMIPTYMVIRNLHMIDTMWAMVIPGSLSVFNIILMRTSMQGIADALEEAARIDGANEFVTMFQIILPLCKAAFAVIMLFTVVGKWNDFMSALLYLPTKTELYPLQMEIRTILFQSTKDITSSTDALSMNLYSRNIQYAVIVVSTLPILAVYPFVQKYFVTGMTIGAVK